jgi:hypothetical protein
VTDPGGCTDVGWLPTDSRRLNDFMALGGWLTLGDWLTVWLSFDLLNVLGDA